MTALALSLLLAVPDRPRDLAPPDLSGAHECHGGVLVITRVGPGLYAVEWRTAAGKELGRGSMTEEAPGRYAVTWLTRDGDHEDWEWRREGRSLLGGPAGDNMNVHLAHD